MDYNETALIKPVNTEGVISRQSEEVKAMVFMAKQFPRDEQAAINKILKACERPTLAEKANYEYPRGGQKITGPSIRLAEVLAQSWGNIDFGVKELEQKNGESTVEVYAWDLETNTRQAKVFTQKHERKAHGGINVLTDPRDIYEIVANNGARRMRACILGIIPGDVIEAAVEKCKTTLAANVGNITDRIQKMIKAFEEYKVTKEMLEKCIGCKIEAFSPNDIVKLAGIYNSLKDGMSKAEDHFDIKTVTQVNSKAEAEFKEKQGGKDATQSK